MKRRITAVVLICIGFAAGFVTCYILKNTPRQLLTQPLQPAVSSSSPLAVDTPNRATGQHRFGMSDGPRKDDSFVRYFGQAGLAQYQGELPDLTRSGALGTFHFVFYGLVAR